MFFSFHGWDKITKQSNLREEGIDSAHSLRVHRGFSWLGVRPWRHSSEDTVARKPLFLSLTLLPPPSPASVQETGMTRDCREEHKGASSHMGGSGSKGKEILAFLLFSFYSVWDLIMQDGVTHV